MKKIIIPVVVLVVLLSAVIAAPTLGKTLSSRRAADQSVSPGCCESVATAAPSVSTSTVIEDELPSCCLPASDFPAIATKKPVAATDPPVEPTAKAECCD